MLIDMADGHALLLATAEELGVIVKEDGGFTAKVGVYKLVLKANSEVGVTAHVVSVAATDPATGVTVYANDTTPDADVLRKTKAGDADAIAALIELAGAVAKAPCPASTRASSAPFTLKWGRGLVSCGTRPLSRYGIAHDLKFAPSFHAGGDGRHAEDGHDSGEGEGGLIRERQG